MPPKRAEMMVILLKPTENSNVCVCVKKIQNQDSKYLLKNRVLPQVTLHCSIKTLLKYNYKELIEAAYIDKYKITSFNTSD